MCSSPICICVVLNFKCNGISVIIIVTKLWFKGRTILLSLFLREVCFIWIKEHTDKKGAQLVPIGMSSVLKNTLIKHYIYVFNQNLEHFNRTSFWYIYIYILISDFFTGELVGQRRNLKSRLFKELNQPIDYTPKYTFKR